ncbi:MAG: MFS transporter [Chitinophagaceae bacterium]|nr:MFS transporter [Chitinophagaceae bacterium]
MSNFRWRIGALIFFATTINYLDRQVISLLKPYLEKEFQWTESDYSDLVIAFQVSYAIGMLWAGSTIDRLGTRIGYGLSLFLWSIAAVSHAFASGKLSFGFLRSFLGLTEAGNIPGAVKVVAEWFPQKERAFMTGIFNSGTNIGAVLAPATVPWLVTQYGWRMTFVITGCTGLIWLIFWFACYDVPAKHKRISKSEFDYIHSDPVETPVSKSGDTKISWFVLLTNRATWAYVVGKFLTDGVWWFFLFWLPAFLSAEYGLVNTEVSLPLAIVYTMTTFGSIGGGWLPMQLMRNLQWDAAKARRISMFFYAIFPLLVIFSQWAGSMNMWYAVIFIGIAASAHQAWSANLYTTVSDRFPKTSVATVIGIGGTGGAIGGILLAWIAGHLFDYYKRAGHIHTGYKIVFVYCGLAYIVAWVIMFVCLKATPLKPGKMDTTVLH